jgi:hypothetical protein
MPDSHDILDPFESEALKKPLDGEWAAKREIAAQTRRFMEHLVTCTTDAESLQKIAAVMKEQADELLKAPRIFGRTAFMDAEDGRYGNNASIGYELNPLGGQSNPLAPPVDTWLDGEKAYGRANMGWHYEGPPNSVHGGYVAALFDQFMGIAQKLTGQPGVTGTLTIRYIKPTPLLTDLKLVAYVEKVEGRKNFIHGEMWAGEVMTASCHGIFISITQEQFRQLNNEVGRP